MICDGNPNLKTLWKMSKLQDGHAGVKKHAENDAIDVLSVSEEKQRCANDVKTSGSTENFHANVHGIHTQ